MPEAAPPRLRLSDLCSNTFLYLTSFRRQASHGSLSVAEAEQRLADVWREEEKRSESVPELYDLYKKARYLLVVTADEVMRTTEWAGAQTWPSQEAEQFGTSIGGERFFALMEDPTYRNPELAEVFFQCLALGFQGMHAGDTAGLRDMRKRLRLGMEDVPRDRAEFLTPEVYEHTQGEDFTTMPVASTVRLLIILIGVVLTLGLLAKVTYSASVNGLIQSANEIAKSKDGLGL